MQPRRRYFRLRVLQARLLAAAGFIICLYCWSDVERGVHSLWEWLKRKQIASFDSFEPIVATLSFGLWINLFRVADATGIWNAYRIVAPPKVQNSTSRPKFWERNWKKIFLVSVDFPQSSPKATRSSCFGIPFPRFEATTTKAGLVYVGILYAFDALYPRRVSRPYYLAENPSMVGMVVQVAAALLLYDFCFFWLHRAMHTNSAIARLTGHSIHHRQSRLRSGESVHHSLVDGAFQVLVNILVLNLLGLPALSRAMYNVVVTYLLVESHSGYDCPWMIHNILPAGILGGPRQHEAHHHTGGASFHQFFCYLNPLGNIHAGKRIN
eukprot:INCI19199.1.p1 GENE.INCI19199.1~~INCI19199.1.p1  ORF type:complete len:324 (-),score=27.57 INCI19199.1:35-1006(-)